ncbi:MAG: peptidylprolyl isomerase [Deltaproteobacteria bacterium]|jgi:FKBP-type peptidyl-prolyl cis-trans isomerase SlyD|nr:MAG: peptidylprolyl isomerase [Deltaproteobacteria bacterium]
MQIKIWQFIGIAGLFGLSVSTAVSAQNNKDEKVIKDGSVVSLQYTLSGDDGKTIESNKGKEPLKYTQGQHQIIPGLEKELTGMKVGGEKRIKVKPEDAYGPIDPKAIQEFPKEKIPPEGQKVGAILTARGPQGQAIPVKVKEVKEKTVVLDMNHPMAGKTLVFDIKVLEVEPGQSSQPTQPAQPAQPAQPK